MAWRWPSPLRKRAFSFLAVVVLIGAVVGYAALTSFESSRSSGVYRVVTRNMMLKGQAAIVPCIGFNLAACPSAENASLSPVDLIEYGGVHYYLYHQTAPSGAPLSQGQTTEPDATYEVWFTNSTVFCISPAHPLTNTNHQNRTCPTLPFAATSIRIPTPWTSYDNPSIGLRLNLTLTADSSGALTVTVNVLNARDTANNLTAVNHWPDNPSNFFLWVQGGCDSATAIPMGYEILRGNYESNNFTTATPLTLEAQPQTLCPYEAPTPYYAFGPLSDIAATYQYGNIPSLAGVYRMPLNTSCNWTPDLRCWWNDVGPWSGYWTGSTYQSSAGELVGGYCPGASSPESCPLTLNLFPSGTYTVVAADEWGQIAVLHFNVQS